MSDNRIKELTLELKKAVKRYYYLSVNEVLNMICPELTEFDKYRIYVHYSITKNI